jgi:hypothetical protein
MHAYIQTDRQTDRQNSKAVNGIQTTLAKGSWKPEVKQKKSAVSREFGDRK